MTSGSKVMCRKKVDTAWSIYRVFTVPNNVGAEIEIKIPYSKN